MNNSTLKNSLVLALTAASLFACASDPNLDAATGPIDGSPTLSMMDLSKSPLFDQVRLVRTFETNELEHLNIRNNRFRLALFDGVTREFQVNRVNMIGSSGLSWFGRVDSDQYSYFSVTYRNGQAVGSALIDGVSYRIRTGPDNRIELAQLSTHDTVDCESTHQHVSTQGGR